MYPIYVILLLALAYLAPALALWPRLPARPLGAAAVPILSAAIVVALAYSLHAISLLNRTVVLGVSAALVVAAAVRVYRAWPRARPNWSSVQRWCALICLIVIVPVALRLGVSSFAADDEIYSWNLWAINYVRGEDPDFYYTTVPYPQAFSLFLAWGYLVLGDLELQMPLRFTLAMFPLAMCLAVAASVPREESRDAARFALLLFGWLFLASVKSHLDNGLADPLMAAALVVSVALYLEDRRAPRPGALAPLVLTALLAALTKQPALIWACLVLPLLLLARGWRQPGVWLAALALVGVPAAWALTSGHGFWENRGVVEASLAGREPLAQLGFAIETYLLKRPAVVLLLLAAGWSAWANRPLLAVLGLAVLPMLIAWFAFGAYELRLGIHVLSLLALLTAAGGYPFPLFHWPRRWWEKAAGGVWSHRRGVALGLAVPSLLACALIVRAAFSGPEGASLYQAGARTVSRHFGDAWAFVMSEVYARPERKVWAPSNYVYGIFYGSTPVMRPDYRGDREYSYAEFIDELIRERPYVVVDPGERLAVGNARERLIEALAHCPAAFDPVPPGNRSGYRVWIVDQQQLNVCHFGP